VVRFLGLRRRPPVTGTENIAHEPVTALDDFSQDSDLFRGHVRYSGERWNAVCEKPVKAGEHLEVSAIKGLTIVVTNTNPRQEAR
jgi:membrane-bound serine protease (ClpP class)